MNPQLRDSADPPCAGPSGYWLAEVRRGRTEAEVVENVRVFLADLSHDEICRLPPDCLPPRIRDGEDVSSYAFNLTMALIRGDPAIAATLQRLVPVLNLAAERIAEIGSVARISSDEE